MLRPFLILAALVAASALLTAQTVTSAVPVLITVTGAPEGRAADLEALLAGLAAPEQDSIVAVIRVWYAQRGALHADAMIETTAVAWTVRVTEGPFATVDEVRIEGIPAAEVTLLEPSLTLKSGGMFLPGLLERDIASLLAQAERSGRPLASVAVERCDDVDDSSGCRVSIVLRVTPGPALSIGAVRAVGNSATTTATVRRASGLREGDVWTSTSAASAVRRLQRTRLFTNVGEPVVELNEQQRLVVTLPVTEGRHSAFDGMIGYLPPSSDGRSGTVTGLVDVRLGNLLGTARKLSLRWFQERQGTNEIDLAYREPWILGSEIDGEVEFHQRKQDSLYVRQQLGVGASGRLDGSVTVGVSFSSTSTTPVEGYGSTVLASSDQRLFGVWFASESRDDAVTPRSGIYYRADLQAGRKRSSGAGGASSASMQRWRGDVLAATSPFPAQTIIVEAHGLDVRSSTLDVADLVRLGGAASLRGYREGEFLGSRMAWGTLEYRLFFTPLSFIGAFVDGGFVRRPELALVGLAGVDLVRFGYGVTFRIEAPVGLLGISIALGEGDGFGDAKLHVRVQSEF